jgi:hypothetical protein
VWVSLIPIAFGGRRPDRFFIATLFAQNDIETLLHRTTCQLINSQLGKWFLANRVDPVKFFAGNTYRPNRTSLPQRLREIVKRKLNYKSLVA